jgi:hypothetical protein
MAVPDLLQITSNYFCAGVVVQDGAVTRAAPILKYMRGWTIKRVRTYCKIKDWDCQPVSQGTTNE